MFFIIYYPNTTALASFKSENQAVLDEMKNELPIIYAENTSFEGIRIEAVHF